MRACVCVYSLDIVMCPLQYQSFFSIYKSTSSLLKSFYKSILSNSLSFLLLQIELRNLNHLD